MGYQESWFYMEPQRKFDKLIRAYERAESAGYYRVAGAEPCSVAILKQPFGDVPAGSKVLWVCGDRGFHSVGGVFGDALHCRARIRVIPVEEDLDSAVPTENNYMRRYSVQNYAHRMRTGRVR